MRPCALRIATLSFGALLLLSSAAFAAKAPFEAEPLVPGPFGSITVGHPQPNGTCEMGILDTPAFVINYLLPPDDAYYTLLDPANCSCPNGSIQINTAHVLLRFPSNCSQPVIVRVVPAVDAGGGCLAPDPNTTLCGPYTFNLAPGAAGDWQFNMPIPAGCCITEKVFLDINFIAPGVGCSTSATRPRLITTGNCEPCTSYNIYPGGFDDLCADIGFDGNPSMWVDGDCCATTSAERKTWGLVKSLYR